MKDQELPNIPKRENDPIVQRFILADWSEYPPSQKKFVSLKNGYEKNSGLNLSQAQFLHDRGLVYREVEGENYLYFVASLIKAKKEAKENLNDVELLAFASIGGYEVK
jgi:hypothetical protein